MIDDKFKEHSHEEADALIPLQVINSLKESTAKEVHVRCSDTDVFILLMDLASNNHLGALTKLVMLAGTGAKYREADIQERVAAVGVRKARGLIGLHNFTGADWGGKFVRISKNTWAKMYLSLGDDADIYDTFASLDQLDVSTIETLDYKMPAQISVLERFVCAFSNREIWKASCCLQHLAHSFRIFKDRTLFAYGTSHTLFLVRPCQTSRTTVGN